MNLLVRDKTKSSVSLSWSPPEKDGGSPVKGYMVEVHEEGQAEWKRLTNPEKPHLPLDFTIPDLKEGKKAKFRVYAVNEAGLSEPAKTTDVVVQDILSKYREKTGFESGLVLL